MTDYRVTKLREAALKFRDTDRFVAVAIVLRRYVDWFPDDGWAWYTLGDALRRMTQYEEAEGCLTRALPLVPNDMRPYCQVRLAMVNEAVGRHAEAEVQFASAAASDEAAKRAWLWVLRGANLAAAGRHQEVQSCYRRALLCPPNDDEQETTDEIYFNFGTSLLAQGRLVEAREALRRAVEISPEYKLPLPFLEGLEGIEEAEALVADTDNLPLEDG